MCRSPRASRSLQEQKRRMGHGGASRWLPLLLTIALSGIVACGAPEPQRDSVLARIEIQPASLTLTKGESRSVDVIGWDEAGALLRGPFPAEWSSDDPQVATVAKDGTVSARTAGRTRVLARVGALEATLQVQVVPHPIVTLGLITDEPTLRPGESIQVWALGTDASGERRPDVLPDWSVSDEAILTVSPEGSWAMVEGLRAGEAEVRVSMGALSATLALTVVPRVGGIEGKLPELLLVGEDHPLEAVALDEAGQPHPAQVIWTSLTPDLLAISPAGSVEALAPGSGSIHARAEEVERTWEIVVEAPRALELELQIPDLLEVGEASPAVLLAFDQKGRGMVPTHVAWTSSEPEIVSVSGDGLLTALAAGEATIHAGVDDLVAEGVARVRPPVATVEVFAPIESLYLREEVRLQARALDASGIELPGLPTAWSSSSLHTISVEPTHGRATAHLPGTARIEATIAGVTGSIDLESIEVQYQSVHAGGVFECGLTQAGEVLCTGFTPESSGSWTFRERPTPIASPVPLVALSLGMRHGCGLSAAGEAHCFGVDAYGELGAGTSPTFQPTFQPVATSLRFRSIHAGGNMTCALSTAEAGENAYCWGANFYGQLGLGNDVDTATPTPIPGHRFDALALSRVNGEGASSCGRTEDGQLLCWGDNSTGQLGDGTNSASLAPLPVPWASDVDAFSIAALETSRNGVMGHACALTSGQALQCWGNNSAGELGAGQASISLVPVTVPGQWISVHTMRDAAQGTTCALDPQGAAHCWGTNVHGILGKDAPALVPTPTPVLGAARFETLDVAPRKVCGMGRDGRAYCWGGILLEEDVPVPTPLLGQR